MNVADIILVKIGEGQRLQMIERGIPQVPVYRHLDLAALICADEIVDHLKNQNHRIGRCKRKDALQRLLCHKMIQCIAVEQRIQGIDQRTENSQNDIDDKNPAVRPDKRPQSRNSEEGQ